MMANVNICLCMTICLVQSTVNAAPKPVLTSDDVIDLTHDHGENALGWPGNVPFKLRSERGPRQVTWNKVPWIENGDFTTAEHLGTHMDAPSHFIKGSWRIHSIPTERFIGPAVKINIRDKVAGNIDYTLTVEDIENWEKKNGRIPNGAIVFLDTGRALDYSKGMEAYVGNTEVSIDNKMMLHCPGFGESAAEFLAKERTIVGVVSDNMSFDSCQDPTFPAHRVFLGAKIWGVENGADMSAVPETGSIATVYPAKIKEGSGAPTRVVVMKTKVGRIFNGAEKQQRGSIGMILSLVVALLVVLCVQ